MGMKSVIANMLAGKEIRSIVEERIKEERLEGGAGWCEKEEQEDRDWRRLTNRDVKQFDPLDQWKMHKICYWLYDKNGLAHRIVERYKDFVVGDGAKVWSPDSQVDDIVQSAWHRNEWEIKQYQKMMELSLYGEQAYPAFVNPTNGDVRLGYIDPTIIHSVLTSQQNAEKRTGFVAEFKDSTIGKDFEIINEDENPASPTYGLLVGKSFFFTVNSVSNAPRGRSDLFPIADSIDAYEQFLFNLGERADILTRIIYDILFEGLTDDEVKKKLKEFTPPRSNEIFGHNQKTTLTMKTPELGGQDFTTTAKLFLNHILGGAGFPGTWFSSGEGLTKGTAMLMDMPTKKQLKSRQRVFKWMIQYIMRHQVHQKIIYKQLPIEKKDAEIVVELPKIEEKDLVEVASALASTTNSLMVAEENHWLGSDSVKRIYARIVSMLGPEVEALESETKEGIDLKLKQIYMKKKQAPVTKVNSEDEDGND